MHPPFSITFAMLQEQANEITLTKGIELASAGRVHSIRHQGAKICAIVDGTRSYKVTLTPTTSGLVSDCTCPAAEYQPLCKHGIATAVTLMQQQGNPQNPEPSETEEDLLRRFLSQMDKEALIESLLEELGNHPLRWQIWAQKAQRQKNPLSLKQFKQQINQALPLRSVFEWNQVADYFNDAEQCFAELWLDIDALSLEQQWQLVNHALKRLNQALTNIDDSGGYRGFIESELTERLSKLFQQLQWSNQQKADWLFKNVVEDSQDIFPSLEEFGEIRFHAEFLNLCEQAFAQQKPNPKRFDNDWYRARSYSDPLIAAAKRRGDWQAEVAIKTKFAEQTDDWLRICTLCLEQNQPQEAKFWLAKARSQAKRSHEVVECDRIAMQIHEQQGESELAWTLAKQIFNQAPSFAEFKALQAVQQRLDQPDSEWLIDVEQRLQSLAQANAKTYFSAQRDALVWFYLDQHREEDACDWVAQHEVNTEVLTKLAFQVVQRRPLDAITYCFAVAQNFISQTNSAAYQQAVQLLKQLEQALPIDPEIKADFQCRLNHLTLNEKRKRNLIALLDKTFTRHD